jgi:hypothetical protein
MRFSVGFVWGNDLANGFWQLASGFLEYAESIKRWKILHFEQMFHVKPPEIFFVIKT